MQALASFLIYYDFMNYIKYLFPFACLVFLIIFSIQAENSPLDTETKKVSYAIGRQIGMSFKAQGLNEDLDFEVLKMSIGDALNGRPSLLNDQQVNEVMTAFQQKQAEKMKAKAELTKTEGGKFMEGNKNKPGVITTDSGLQYQIIKEGTGESPTAADQVKVHYLGTLTDGTEFDSSYKRGQPATFPLGGVIKGWTEALQLMKVGGKNKLFIPSELAYGSVDRPGIPANSTLIFEVELLEIVK